MWHLKWPVLILAAASLAGALEQQLQLGVGFAELLKQLHSQQRFEYALLLSNASDFHLAALLWQLPVPILQLNGLVNYALHLENSKNLLAVACLAAGTELATNHLLLESLVSNLEYLNTAPLLFLVLDEILLDELFEWCWQKQLLNVLAILPDFEQSRCTHSYAPFPKLQRKMQRFEPNGEPIYANHLGNLKGYRLPIAVGGSAPRLIVYLNRQGRLKYAGTVGHLMNCFEKKFNCKFVQPVPLNLSNILPAEQLLPAIDNGTVQFSWGSTFINSDRQLNYTRPYEQVSYCIMLPVEASLAPSDFYTAVFELNAFLLTLTALMLISVLLSLALLRFGHRPAVYEFLLHEDCLRGVLGQSFVEIRGAPLALRNIYLVITILGILFTAVYNAFFSAYITSAPLQAPLDSYESIIRSGIKVAIWDYEYRLVMKDREAMVKYEEMFLVEPDYNKFLQLRDSFNTKYGYVMPSTKWDIINEQQKVFTAPLFRLREDMCFYDSILVSFPVSKNCIFKEPLEQLMLEVTDTGLLDHWRKIAFNEMIEAGKLQLADLGEKKGFRTMQLKDLLYIWQAGGIMFSLALVVFLLELTCFRCRRMWIYFKSNWKI